MRSNTRRHCPQQKLFTRRGENVCAIGSLSCDKINKQINKKLLRTTLKLAELEEKEDFPTVHSLVTTLGLREILDVA